MSDFVDKKCCGRRPDAGRTDIGRTRPVAGRVRPMSKNHKIGVPGVNFIRFESDFHRSMRNLIVHPSKCMTNRTKCK